MAMGKDDNDDYNDQEILLILWVIKEEFSSPAGIILRPKLLISG